MGIILLVFGTILMVPAVMFLTLCMANIILADSLIAAILAGVTLHIIFHLHPVLCILAVLLVLAGMTWLYTRDLGYVILRWISVSLWGYLTGFLAYDISRGDLLWGAFFALLAATISYGLHEYARCCMRAW